jgi:hypothetical protein
MPPPSPPPRNESALEEIARIMIDHGVEFVVIGGQAEAAFGSPRITYHVDQRASWGRWVVRGVT